MQVKSETRVQGTLQAIRYSKNNWMIGILKDSTAVKGVMPAPQPGLEYEFDGKWENDPKYGWTFAFKDYKASCPTRSDAVESYLMENCRWIGPEIAKRIVKRFGKDTLPICRDDPDQVAREIKGVSRKHMLEISALLQKIQEDEEVNVALFDFFSGTQIGNRVKTRILEKWGKDAPERIREDPYGMIEEIKGIGFLTADIVARKLGYEVQGGPRIQAGILHTLLDQSGSGGHVCLPREKLLIEAIKILGIPPDPIDAELPSLEMEDKIFVSKIGDIYLRRLRDDEELVAETSLAIVGQTLPPGQPESEGLADDQREALQTAMESGAFILTGAPGTGKTYTIKKIIESFPNSTISLAAPTGKAAKRMMEESDRPAQTIHRLLGWTKSGDEMVWTRNRENPLTADLIVLDEVSMIGVELMARFLDAVAPGTRLILVGDTYQLPAVGPGNILRDLIASGKIPTQELHEIKRQAAKSLIVRNCHHIKNGQDIEIIEDSEEFIFIEMEEEGAISDAVLDLVSRHLPERYNADPLQEIQVITPRRDQTPLSAKALNWKLQERLNLNPEIEKCKYRLGDKVIQTRNDYEKDLINGDIGLVHAVDKPKSSISIQFENPTRIVELPLYENDLLLAYAITCHKFQGSEARIVVVPVHRSAGSKLLQRNWIYTAVSRAKQVCVLVGQRGEVRRAIGRDEQERRHTGLLELMGEQEERE